MPTKRAFLLPRGIRRNQYGSMPKGAAAATRARPNMVSGRIDSVPGLRQRLKDGTKDLLFFYAYKATSKPWFGFKVRTIKAAQAAWPAAFRQTLAKVLPSAWEVTMQINQSVHPRSGSGRCLDRKGIIKPEPRVLPENDLMEVRR